MGGYGFKFGTLKFGKSMSISSIIDSFCKALLTLPTPLLLLEDILILLRARASSLSVDVSSLGLLTPVIPVLRPDIPLTETLLSLCVLGFAFVSVFAWVAWLVVVLEVALALLTVTLEVAVR